MIHMMVTIKTPTPFKWSVSTPTGRMCCAGFVVLFPNLSLAIRKAGIGDVH